MTRYKRDVFSAERFAERFNLALEMNPNAPPKYHGERVWLSEQLLKKGVKATPETIRKWLTAAAMPTHEKVPLLAEILGVDVDWLLYGDEERIKKPAHLMHSTIAAGATNLVAGIIQVGGGDALFPAEQSKGHVHLNAVIDRATYPLHITMGEMTDDGVEFLIPGKIEDCIVIGVVQRGEDFAFDLYEIPPDKQIGSEIRRGRVVVKAQVADLRQITSFAERL